MRITSIVLAALAASVLLAGAAGAVAAQPDDAGANGDAGPPEDLPDPVPDFVSDIHDSIGDFLSGGIDRLGDAVSGVTPGGDDSDGAGNSSDSDQ